jgi:hypothetical protein
MVPFTTIRNRHIAVPSMLRSIPKVLLKQERTLPMAKQINDARGNDPSRSTSSTVAAVPNASRTARRINLCEYNALRGFFIELIGGTLHLLL